MLNVWIGSGQLMLALMLVASAAESTTKGGIALGCLLACWCVGSAMALFVKS